MKLLEKRIKGNYANLIFSGGEEIKIHVDFLTEFNLEAGEEIEFSIVKTLKEISKKHEAKLKALNLLARRAHSKRELTIKLLQRKIEKEIIEQIIPELERAGFLNDADFARLYAEEKISRKRLGPLKIKSELIKKGISKEIIDETISAIDRDTIYRNCKYLLEKKMNFIRETDERKLRNKLYSYLNSKGYEAEIIYELLGDLSNIEF
ncbi:MAG: regulatory protein RecX [Chlorobi bacterium]|nr:regulatory protein RecX [Chlorobiota bacterium]